MSTAIMKRPGRSVLSYLYPARHCRTAEYTASPEAVTKARKETMQALKDWGLLASVETAELLVSELVTNAVRATGLIARREGHSDLIRVPHVMVQLRIEGDHLLILVWDGDPNPPMPKYPQPDDEGGRGLQLVGSLSQQWGYYEPDAGGKVVWCQLAL